MALPRRGERRSHPSTPLYYSNIKDVVAAAGGGSLTGGGTTGKPARWTGASSLGDSTIMTEIAGALELNPGVLDLKQTDNALEGGEIILRGGGNGGTPFKDWHFDSWSGALRFWEAASTRHQFDSLYAIHYNMQLGDVGHGVNWAGLAHSSRFNSTDYAILQNNVGQSRINSAVGQIIDFCHGNVQKWEMNNGIFRPMTDATFDIGSAAQRVKDLYLSGESVAENGAEGSTVSQPGFTNVATDIVGTQFDIGPSEKWLIDCTIPFLPTSTAGAQWAPVFTGLGGGAVCGLTVFGTTTSVTAFGTEYIAAAGVFSGLRGTTAASHFIRITGTIQAPVGAGVFKIQGRSGAAGTSIGVRPGVMMNARRLS